LHIAIFANNKILKRRFFR